MRVEEEDEEVSGITGSMVRALPFALPFAKSSDDPNIASGCGEIQSSQSILSQWRRSTHPINRPSGMGHGTDAAEAAAFTTAASTAAASNASASTTANAADAAPRPQGREGLNARVSTTRSTLFRIDNSGIARVDEGREPSCLYRLRRGELRSPTRRSPSMPRASDCMRRRYGQAGRLPGRRRAVAHAAHRAAGARGRRGLPCLSQQRPPT